MTVHITGKKVECFRAPGFSIRESEAWAFETLYDLGIRYDSSVLAYFNYSLPGILTLARGVLTCALNREESRGAHYRSDCPDTDESFAHATLISYDGGHYRTWLDTEGEYES